MAADKKKLILHSLAILLSSAAVVSAVLGLIGKDEVSIIYTCLLVSLGLCCSVFATNIQKSSLKSDKDENCVGDKSSTGNRSYSDNKE